MSSSLGYSLIEGSESNNSTISKNNKTRRNKITRESLTENKLKTSNVSISAFKEDEDENDNNYNEEPIIYPDRNQQSAGIERVNVKKQSMEDPPVENTNETNYLSPMQYSNNETNNVYNQQPYATNETFQNSQMTESELTQKLNYMINLLEEQHDDKIKSVTEEIILYGFLGVFIIYIVDSFAKIGKYVR